MNELNKEEPSKEALNKKEFNKEAYLDLSKPYQQSNPQSAKQDNQATLNGFNTIVQSACIHPINTHLTATCTKCI
jgi:hypothetical protein